jgi:hypothetical protein
VQLLQSRSSIFSSEALDPAQAARHCRSTVIWAALVLIGVIAVIEWTGQRIGVTLTPPQIAEMQAADHRLIWAGPLQLYAMTKLDRIASSKPEIVLIGHSRGHQMRSAMFKPYSFYNFCPTIGSIDQITEMIKRVDDASHPRVIMFTIDYFMMTEQWPENITPKMAMSFEYYWRDHFDGLIRLGTNIKNHPLLFLEYLLNGGKSTAIDGFDLVTPESIRGNAGFRYDGSFMVDTVSRAAASIKTRNPIDGILSATPGAQHMAASQIQALRNLADVGRRRNITLVGIQLPILKSAVDYLDTNVSYRPYAGAWREFESEDTRRLFKELGITFFDLSRDSVTEDPRNFIDSGHPTEVAVLGSLVHLLDVPEFRAIFPKLDGEALRKEYADAQKSGATFDVYHDRF